MKKRRPASVTWLALGVLTLTGINILRVAKAFSQWEFLNSLSLPVPVIYFVVSGLIWSAMGLFLYWGLWTGKSNTYRLLFYSSAAYTVYYWIDWLVISINPLKVTNTPFMLAMTFLLLALIYWIVTRPRARLFFGEMNERRPEDPTTT